MNLHLPIKSVFALACLCFFAISSHAQTTVTIDLDPQHPGAKIPADFVGLSYEMQRVLPDTNGDHFFSARNHRLIATFKTLGIKNLRVGGNTADRPTLPIPNEMDADNLFAFAQAADVKVIYTLRLNQGSLDTAVEMAKYISRHYPKQLDCFAIGNEPNVFSTNYQVYVTEWKRYAAALTAPTNCPEARFCGPSTSPGHESWSRNLASDPEARRLLAFISQHDYPGGDARSVKDPPAARDKILAPAMDAHYAKFAANFVPTVLSNGVAYRFEEANSFYDGGASNVSDTFTAALWALNYQWWWAEHGMSGINFHTGDKVAARDENKPCRYASFWTVTNGYNVHPIAYAEKMFSLGQPGRIMPVKISSATTDLNFTAYGVFGEDKDYYVTLINKTHDLTATNLQISINAPAHDFKRAEIMRLANPGGNVSLKTGTTLGGAEITDQAKWHGTWQPVTISSDKSQATFELPAASAAVMKLTPK